MPSSISGLIAVPSPGPKRKGVAHGQGQGNSHGPAAGIRLLLALFSLGAVGGLGACAKVSGAPDDGTGAVTGTGGVRPGTGGVPASGGATGGTAEPDASVITMDASICTDIPYKFTPKVPTVYLLVDRSGSMFHCLTGNTGDVLCADATNTSWGHLKEAVRTVVSKLDKDVRFGFTTIWGTNPQGQGTCPSLQGMATDVVMPALSNATAIMTKYDSLPLPPNSNQVGIKFESPASESIQVTAAALEADSTPGDKYIIFITDGEPDYCDDSNALCAPDSVIAQIQVAKAAGITTIVLGIQTSLFDLAPGTLKAYATAGAGESTVAPLKGNGTINDFYDQCAGITGWHDDLVALGRPAARGSTLGTYMATAGPTNPYMPSATDQTKLVDQLSQALSGVKSCIFDMGNIDGKSVKVDTTRLNEAHVKIMGADVPLDMSNGWRMNTPTQLELTGSACDGWRKPDVNMIEFQFPCDLVSIG